MILNMKITIDNAIEQSKKKGNISYCTKCFDFGECVLLLYTKKNEYGLAREDAEIAMQGINRLVDLGVNTPRYYEIKRMKDDNFNYCYILQDKAKGKQCDEIVDFNEILSIPQEHYDKLAYDLCQLKNMGIEAYKGKNLFYDNESGFWIIDLTPSVCFSSKMTDEQALEQMYNFVVNNGLFLKYSPEEIKQLAQIEETKRQIAIEKYVTKNNQKR